MVARLDQLGAAIVDRGWVVLHTHAADGGGLVYYTAGLTVRGLPEVYLRDADAPAGLCPGGHLEAVTGGWAWDVVDQVAAACVHGVAALSRVAAVHDGGRDDDGRPVDHTEPLIVQLHPGSVGYLAAARLVLGRRRLAALEILPYSES